MKKILIRIVVLVLVFAAAVFGTSKILGKKMADTSEDGTGYVSAGLC